MKHLLALAVLFFSVLVQGVHAQQECWVLGRFGRIWRVEDYQTSNPILTEFPIQSIEIEGVAGSRQGIDIDPDTGDIFVLLSNESLPFNPNSYIVRYDRVTGAATLELTIPVPFLSGLARRWDGNWYTIHDDDFHSTPHQLWLLDAQTGTPTTQVLEQGVSAIHFQPLAIEANGNVLMNFPSLGLRTIDPISGNVLAEKSPPQTGDLILYAADQSSALWGASLSGFMYRFDSATGEWVDHFDPSAQTSFLFDIAFRYGPNGQGYASLCDGQINSTGRVGTLELLGNAVAANNQLELISRNLPANVFGYYILSNQVDSLPIGRGLLCLGQPLYRYSNSVLVSSAEGTVRFSLNLGQLANGLPALPGDTYHFQLWHRDTIGGVGTSNLSSAVSVTFE